jgi:hypothetical protein
LDDGIHSLVINTRAGSPELVVLKVLNGSRAIYIGSARSVGSGSWTNGDSYANDSLPKATESGLRDAKVGLFVKEGKHPFKASVELAAAIVR